MTPADFDTFSKIVTGFAELKGKQLSAAAIKLYWGAMQAWTIEDFRAAAEHLLRSCEFMPTPKDFEDLRKAGRETAAEAWTRALDLAAGAIQCGQVVTVRTGNELLDRAVRAVGGWRALALCESEKLHFLERRFAQAFEEMRDATDTRQSVPQIAGPARRQVSGPVSVAALLKAQGSATAEASP